LPEKTGKKFSYFFIVNALSNPLYLLGFLIHLFNCLHPSRGQLNLKQRAWHLFCRNQLGTIKPHNGFEKLEGANHPRGWDAKPLALILERKRQQGCRARTAPTLSASRSV
jgi:hypothetical protein